MKLGQLILNNFCYIDVITKLSSKYKSADFLKDKNQIESLQLFGNALERTDAGKMCSGYIQVDNNENFALNYPSINSENFKFQKFERIDVFGKAS